MSVRRDPRSPWGLTVWLSEDGFDARMDALRARAGTELFKTGRGIDVDLLLLRVFRVDPDFVELPVGCLGRTMFYRDGTYRVEIQRELADEAVESPIARRRLRSTLAHETAHIELHGVLHPVSSGPALFEELEDRPTTVMCRDESIRLGGRGVDEPWEYQANRGMASLLMPRTLLKERLAACLQARAFEDLGAALEKGDGERVVRGVASAFDVSLQMTVYRLQQLGYMPKDADQGGLAYREG